MKKVICFLLSAFFILFVTACGALSPADVDNAVIDYGNSGIYTKEEMDEAIKLIKDEFSDWDGCILKTIKYGSDENCGESELERLKELKVMRNANEEFTQCIMFVTDFYSPEYDDPDYTDFFNWWLARAEGGNWILVSWGHP